jgi:Cys-tRNA(Pro)/Cys-tRNA(Cys) deacylase
MTPAVKIAERAGIEFELIEYAHDANAASYGEEAAVILGQAPQQVFKTLIAKLDNNKLVVGIVPVCGQLDLKALAASQKAKKASMAAQQEAERSTGYVLGGISPLGQKRPLATTLDASALNYNRIFVSGGKRGLEIALAPQDLQRLCEAVVADIRR